MTLHDFSDIHTHRLDAGDDAIINLPALAPMPDHGYYSVGLHPWDSDTVTAEHLEWLEHTAAHPRVVAIGECGLDALRGAPIPEQERIFRHHVQLSERLQKPLIIHSVRTLADIMRLRRQLRPTQQWIIHGFRGKPATARQLIALGIDISLGEKHHPELPGDLPSQHIYHETD